jgi:hypothetical protein
LTTRPGCGYSLRVAPTAAGQQPYEPTAAEISKKETVAAPFLRRLQYQEYQVRSAAEAMPEDKYSYRPAEGKFKEEKPQFGPAEVRTFAEQVKHVACCANFGFASGARRPQAAGRLRQGRIKSRQGQTRAADLPARLVCWIRKSLGAMNAQNQFDPIEGPYAGPNTSLGIATVIVWHNADHYGQMTLYLRLNGIVPPASRTNPPEVKDTY